MSTPAYLAPYIDATGLHIPSYQSILADNIAQYKNIYGQSVYLGNDASDYQRISVESLKCADVCQALQLVYNSRSILGAVGTALDALVKPIVRKPASFSTATVQISGTAGILILFGQVQDINGNLWALPQEVTIGNGGTVLVTATAQTPGPISAAIGTINIKAYGITAGWNAVTNTTAAILGEFLEADSSLRARAVASLALPSQTRLAGTTAAIEALPNVTRLNCVENFTGATDANGNPPHSITCVVEGGSSASIANAIYSNKTIGCLTNGQINGSNVSQTVSVQVTDPVTGVQANISFLTPAYLVINVNITLKGFNGFSTTVAANVADALNAYLNSLEIGQEITYSALYGAALAVTPDLTKPLFSITALTVGTSSPPTGTTDITVAFYQVSQAGTILVTQT